MSAFGFEVPEIDITNLFEIAGNTSRLSDIHIHLAVNNNVRLEDSGFIRSTPIERDTTMVFPFWRVANGNQAAVIAEIDGQTFNMPASDASFAHQHIRACAEKVKVNWNPVLLSGYQAVTDPAGSGLRELDNYTGFNQGGGIEAISRVLTRGSAGLVARGSLTPPILPLVKLVHQLNSILLFHNNVMMVRDPEYFAFCDTAANLRPDVTNVDRAILYGLDQNGAVPARDVENYLGRITYNRFCRLQFGRTDLPINFHEGIAYAERNNALSYVPYFSSSGLSLAQLKQLALAFCGLNLTVATSEHAALATNNGYGVMTAYSTYQLPNGTVQYAGDQHGRFAINGRLFIFVDMDNVEEDAVWGPVGSFEAGMRVVDSAEVPGLLQHISLIAGDAAEAVFFHAAHTAHYRVPAWRQEGGAVHNGFHSAITAALLRTVQPVIAPPATRLGTGNCILLPYASVDAIHFAYARPWVNRIMLSPMGMFAAELLLHLDVQTKLVSKIFELNEDVTMRYSGPTLFEMYAHKFSKYLDGTLARLQFVGTSIVNAIDSDFACPVPYLPADWLPKFTSDSSMVAVRRLVNPSQVVYTRHFVFSPLDRNYMRLTNGNNNVDAYWPAVRAVSTLRDRNVLSYHWYYPATNSASMSIVCVTLPPQKGLTLEEDTRVRSFRHGEGPIAAVLAVGDWTF